MSGFYGKDYDDEGNEIVELPPPSNPMAVARELAADYLSDDHLTLIRWRGGWMQWHRTHWAEVEETVVRSWLYRRLEHAAYEDTSGRKTLVKPWEPNRKKISDVADALTAIIHVPETTDPPAWLTGNEPVPAGEIVACSNGLLHVGTRKLHDHTPRFFGMVAVPFAYEQAAPEPARWLRFLGELWPGDPDSVAALQEWFGYVLSGRTDLHKILLLIGPTRSGKGTIARILTAMVGKGNAAGPTLASLGTNFGLSPLLGKPLAVVSDARLGGASVHQVVERLLSVSGEDMLTVDRKYREPWTGKLPSRFLLLSNELPRFGDASGAISHRFVVLTMTESFLGRENTRLTADLLGELPGILSWSLDGLDRLTRQGSLTEPASSADAIVALQDLVSPVSAFVRDRCRRGGQVPVAELFAEWKAWCEDNGHRAGSVQTFGRDLRAVVPVLRVAQPRDEAGRQSQRHYIGISLSPAHNGETRVSPRVSDPDLTRSDTRTSPLSAGLEHTVPKPACPRHQTGWGAHPKCPECQELAAEAQQ
jgi:putative DNA primase/helicase